MTVAGLALDVSNRSPIVLLRDPSQRRQVPIWIDHSQAHNIMSGIQSNSPKSPQTHDLIMKLLEAGRMNLEKVIIHSIEENTFQAVLRLKLKAIEKDSNKEDENPFIEIDARPSDAIALAVRSKSSIWMLEEVVAEASIPVDADADEEDQDQFKKFVGHLSPSDLVRHLENLKENKEESSEFPDIDPNSAK